MADEQPVVIQGTLIDEKRNLAYQLNERLHAAVVEHVRLYLVIGKLLNEINDGGLYKYIGDDGVSDFDTFLNVTLGFPSSTARLYMRVYTFYVQKLELPEEKVLEIPLNRLMRLLPSLKKMTPEEAKKILAEVGPLINSDYQKEIEERKLETPRPILRRHNDCQKWIFEFRPEQMCNCEIVEGEGASTGIIDKSLLD